MVDPELVQARLPGIKRSPVSDGERQMVQPRSELAEGVARSPRSVIGEPERRPACGVHDQDLAKSVAFEVFELLEPEHFGVPIGTLVDVRDGQGGMVVAGDFWHLASFLLSGLIAGLDGR